MILQVWLKKPAVSHDWLYLLWQGVSKKKVAQKIKINYYLGQGIQEWTK